MSMFVGDIGTEILINMQRDISTATNCSLTVKKPDGTIVTWTPTIYQVKYFRYITVLNDLDQDGVYQIQPQFTLGTWTGSGTICKIEVFKKIG